MEFKDRVVEHLRDKGREEEIAFWKNWISHDGDTLSNRAGKWCDAVPNPEIEIDILLMLRAVAFYANQRDHALQVLDIGSGPISILTRCFENLKVELSAVDPLANEYDSLWPDDPEHYRKACRPEMVSGESLSSHFGESTFDVAHIRNAIDHVTHPMVVISEMIKIVRPGGLLVVYGNENEALRHSWAGFHQWNMCITPDGAEFKGVSNVAYRPAEVFRRELKLIHEWRTLRAAQAKRYWCAWVAGVTKA
jgi:SAM-dependent methyltransferase